MKKILLFIFALLTSMVICASNQAFAAVQIDIYGPGQNIVNMAMATPLKSSGGVASNLGPSLEEAIKSNLSFLPFVRITPSNAILGGSVLEGYKMPGIDLRRFQLAGADLLITTGWVNADNDGSIVELRIYETYSGKFVFGNAYENVKSSELQKIADQFCSDLMKALTGNGDFFISTLAIAKNHPQNPRQRDIWLVSPMGRDLRQITYMPGMAMSPAWSPDGQYVVFSQIDDRTHGLGVWNSTTGKLQRIRFPGNTVIGPAFMPDNKVAVSLSSGKYPDIFLLNRGFERERALEESPSINVSPSFDASGKLMAFCSIISISMF